MAWTVLRKFLIMVAMFYPIYCEAVEVHGSSLQQAADVLVDDVLAASSDNVQQIVRAGVPWQMLRFGLATLQGLYRLVLMALTLLRFASQPLLYMASWLYTIMRPGLLIVQLFYRAVIGIPLETMLALGHTLYPAYLYLTTAAFIGLTCGVTLAVSSQLLLLLLPSSQVRTEKGASGSGAGFRPGNIVLPNQAPVDSSRTGRTGYFDRGPKQGRALGRSSIALRSTSQLQSSTISEVAEDMQWSANDTTP